MWHKNNDFPVLEQCELLFTDSATATGRTTLSLAELRAEQQNHDTADGDLERTVENIVDMSQMSDTGDGNDDELGRESEQGREKRKRSATTSDPKKEGKNKKMTRTRQLEELNAHIGRIADSMDSPMAISKPDPTDDWIDKAHGIWKKDFGWVEFEVAELLFDEWDKNVQTARRFVHYSVEHREYFVQTYIEKHKV